MFVVTMCSYQEIWTPVIGEYLNYKKDNIATENRHAVAVDKPGDIVVGHVSRTISCLLSIY